MDLRIGSDPLLKSLGESTQFALKPHEVLASKTLAPQAWRAAKPAAGSTKVRLSTFDC